MLRSSNLAALAVLAFATSAGANELQAVAPGPRSLRADGTVGNSAKPPKGQLQYLNPQTFAPERLVAAPPAVGSAAEALELWRLHRLIAAASPARVARARWDGDHENPTAFNAVVGRDLAKLPATWALLTLIQKETDAVVDRSKAYFNRPRPWGVDPTLPYCGKGNGKKPVHSYPSGHSGMGYSVGWTLAQLMPDMAPQILARAEDYALSREICGVHFPSDTEASHVIGTLTAATLFADPRLARQVAAARAELRTH